MWICERCSTSPSESRKLYLVGVASGILGARIWYGLQYGGPLTAVGFSYFGFGLGAAAGAAAFHRWSRGAWGNTDFPDAVAPALALGSAVHRLGCFVSGCCFGRVCELPWAVRYSAGSSAYQHHLDQGWIDAGSSQSLPVHPTQLYQTTSGLIAFAVLMWLRRRPRPPQRYEVFLGLVLYYCVYRFFLEFLRDDAGGVRLGPLTFAQGTAVMVFLLAGGLFLYNRLRHSGPIPAEGIGLT